MRTQCLHPFVRGRRGAVFIAFPLFVSVLSHGAFANGFSAAQSHAAANSQAWHSQGPSVVALPSVATVSMPSVFSNGTVDQVPFGLSVAQAARSHNAADPIVLLAGSSGNAGIQGSITFSAPQTSSPFQTLSEPVGLAAADFTSSNWLGDSLQLQAATHLELFSANK